jgi:hypothetical protein
VGKGAVDPRLYPAHAARRAGRFGAFARVTAITRLVVDVESRGGSAPLTSRLEEMLEVEISWVEATPRRAQAAAAEKNQRSVETCSV